MVGLGGSRGLGLALTRHLLRRGTSVTLLDSHDASHALPGLQELACEGASVRAVQVDLASRKEVTGPFLFQHHFPRIPSRLSLHPPELPSCPVA